MKGFLYTVLTLIILNQTAFADDKNAVGELLKSKLDAVFVVLQKEDLDQAAKNTQVIDIVTPMFDFALMSKLTLGRKHWPRLSKENKEKFKELFINLLKESYRDKLTLYTDETVVYDDPLQVKNKIHIPTHLISKGNQISMLYKLYRSKKQWKIYDIEIQGISMISTYRSQFDEILNNGTIEDLLLKLENRKINQPLSFTDASYRYAISSIPSNTFLR
jgi:phospholipid transport system substrate-binding protein